MYCMQGGASHPHGATWSTHDIVPCGICMHHGMCAPLSSSWPTFSFLFADISPLLTYMGSNPHFLPYFVHVMHHLTYGSYPLTTSFSIFWWACLCVCLNTNFEIRVLIVRLVCTFSLINAQTCPWQHVDRRWQACKLTSTLELIHMNACSYTSHTIHSQNKPARTHVDNGTLTNAQLHAHTRTARRVTG